MNRESLKKRVVGAIVLVALGVIFIPYILSNDSTDTGISDTNIGQKPADLLALENREPPAKPVKPYKPVQTTTPIINDVANAKPAPKEDPIKEKPIELKPDTTKPAPVEAKPTETSNKVVWVVQVASFSSRSNAIRLRDKLKKADHTSFVESISANGKTIYRVRVGPFIKHDDAEKSQKQIIDKFKLNAVVLKHP